MGHKLTKMAKAPAGFANGDKMGGKMWALLAAPDPRSRAGTRR